MWEVIVTGVVAAAVLLWLIIAGAKERQERAEEAEIGKDTTSEEKCADGNPRGVREGDRK